MALSYDPNTGQVAGAPQRKSVPNIGQVLQNTFASGALDPFKPSAGLQNQIQQSSAPVQGLNQDFFDSLQNQATQRLQRQYFDPGGVQEQVLENVNTRGLVGSGVEQGILRDQVYNPYGQAVSDVTSDIASQQIQSQFETDKFNRQIGLQGAELQANIESQFNEIGANLALAEQGRLSKEAEADLDRQIAQLELSINAQNQFSSQQLAENVFMADLIQKLGDPSMSGGQRDQLRILMDSFGGGSGKDALDDYYAQNPEGLGYGDFSELVKRDFNPSNPFAFIEARPDFAPLFESFSGTDLGGRAQLVGQITNDFNRFLDETPKQSEMDVHAAYRRLQEKYGVL